MGYILHVSDFHLRGDTDPGTDSVSLPQALASMVETLNEREYEIDYLIHTGDIIDSSDLCEAIGKGLLDKNELGCDINSFYKINEKTNERKFNNQEFENWLLTQSDETIEEYNRELEKQTTVRFEKATEIMNQLISKLRLASSRVVICCGNHDVMRLVERTESHCENWNYEPIKSDDSRIRAFESFLNKFNAANCQQLFSISEPVTYCALRNINILILNTNCKKPS